MAIASANNSVTNQRNQPSEPTIRTKHDIISANDYMHDHEYVVVRKCSAGIEKKRRSGKKITGYVAMDTSMTKCVRLSEKLRNR